MGVGGSLVRLLVLGSIICLLLISLVQYFWLEFYLDKSGFTLRPIYYTDDVTSMLSRLKKEHEYKRLLKNLEQWKLKELEGKFHRDLTIQYSQRSLLPSSLPLYHKQCLSYLDTHYPQTVSVVIVFHNEVATLLMRLLTTLVQRTMPRYLCEVIVIDDCSDIDISTEIKEYAASQRIPVKFLRNEYNIGIAASRIRGIQLAEGDVVALFDSHMEVADLWLEPLLDIISSKPRAIAVPHLVMIGEEEYSDVQHNYPRTVTTLDNVIGAIFENYHGVNESIEPWEHYPSSALMGGGIVALKSTLKLFYPRPLLSNSKWGVENNRLSYRAWLCGEGIWSNDCSKVLHPNGKDVYLRRYHKNDPHFWNKLRTESVGELINFCPDKQTRQALLYKATNQPKLAEVIEHFAEEIREKEFDPAKMHCHSDYNDYRFKISEGYLSFERDQFSWVGEVSSVAHPNSCLDLGMSDRVTIWACRPQPLTVHDNHMVGFTRNGAIMLSNHMCFDTYSRDEEGSAVELSNCHVSSPTEGVPGATQQFQFDVREQWIWNAPTKRCLTIFARDGQLVQGLFPCDETRTDQKWTIKLARWFV